MRLSFRILLTRIFHPHLLWKPGRPMNAALEPNFDLSSMYSYSPASKFASVLPHQSSRLPRHDVYEICGLKSLVPSLLLAVSLTIVGCAGFPNQTSCSGVISEGFSSGPLPQTVCSGPVSQSFCYGSVPQNLCSAGFLPMPVNFCSPGFIQTLPSNQITTIQRGGNNYYVYADPSTHQVLMGQSSALRNYTSIVNKEHSSVTNINQQVASNVVNRQLPSVTNVNQQAARNFADRQLPALAGAGQQAERSIASDLPTRQQLRPVARVGRQMQSHFKNTFGAKRKRHSAPAASSPVSNSEPSASITKNIPSSGSMERGLQRDWKRVGI